MDLESRRRQIMRVRIRMMLALLVLPLIILVGVMPDPFIRPLAFFAGGGILGGLISLSVGVLLGSLGFVLFGVTRRSLAAPPPPAPWPEFSPPVPLVRKVEGTPRWAKTATTILVLCLILLLFPENTGVPRFVVGALLLSFGAAVVLGLTAGLTLLAARGMKAATALVFGTIGENAETRES